MRPTLLLGLAAVALASAASLRAQEADPEWQLEGLRIGFCIQLLLDPASDAVRSLPTGYRAVAASDAKDLHPSLRDVITARPSSPRGRRRASASWLSTRSAGPTLP